MTRDEYRAKCIEAIGDEFAEALDYYWEKINAISAAAFDSLHGIARVDPTEATEEMIYSGELAKADGGDVERVFASMAKVGDLTNPPETKP